MRALRFNGERVAIERDGAEPAAGDGQVLVRLRAGLLGEAELEASAPGSSYRGTLGQGFVGMVGDRRVTAAPIVYCGSCASCVSGLRQHCLERAILGQVGGAGALADAFVLPDTSLVDVPDSVDDEIAVFANLIATALHTARRIAIEGKPYVTVLGESALALLTAQVLARRNASVRAIGADVERLALCERWGVKHRPLADIGRRRDQDVVVVCPGAVRGAVAETLVRPRGSIVVLDPHAELDAEAAVRDELTILGTWGGSVVEAVSALARGEVDATGLASGRTTLDDAGPALERLRNHPALPVVVRA